MSSQIWIVLSDWLSVWGWRVLKSSRVPRASCKLFQDCDANWESGSVMQTGNLDPILWMLEPHTYAQCHPGKLMATCPSTCPSTTWYGLARNEPTSSSILPPPILHHGLLVICHPLGCLWNRRSWVSGLWRIWSLGLVVSWVTLSERHLGTLVL